MNTALNAAWLPPLCAALLALAALASVGANLRHGWRRLTCWAPLPLAALLFLGLFPPVLQRPGATLWLITPCATPQQLRTLPFGELRATLPGAPQSEGAEALPDLATALRRHPQLRSLVVLGGGLPPRDLDAAASLALRFEAAPPQGLLQLQAPPTAQLGQQWTVTGRVAAPGARLELHDPSGAAVDSAQPDAAGAFRVSAALRGTGAARFELHLLRSGQAETTLSVPVLVQGGAKLALLALEGAPGAEGKYWRRWAADAGLDLGLDTRLTQGVSLHEGQAQLTAERLDAADLVMIEARAWATLPAEQKAALRAAVERGLGLLLRADVAPDEATAADWAGLGFRVGGDAAGPHEVVLDQVFGLHERQGFTAAPVTVEARDAQALLTADDGTPLAWARDLGRGRVGLLRLVDSYRLQLLGEPARYGTLWGGLLSALARPQPPPVPGPQLPSQSWVGERAVLCGLDTAATVLPPDGGTPVQLSVREDGCAGYWPAQVGWQTLDNSSGHWPFYVRAANDGADLRAARDRLATQWLATAPQSVDSPSDAASTHPVPLPRWPFLLAWFALSMLAWWKERDNLNRVAGAASSLRR